MGGTVSEPEWEAQLLTRLKNLQALYSEAEGLHAVVRALVNHETEAAFKRGREAGSSKAGYRLVQENESLRRELALAQQTKRREGVCPSCLSALSATESGASAGETPEGASP